MRRQVPTEVLELATAMQGKRMPLLLLNLIFFTNACVPCSMWITALRHEMPPPSDAEPCAVLSWLTWQAVGTRLTRAPARLLGCHSDVEYTQVDQDGLAACGPPPGRTQCSSCMHQQVRKAEPLVAGWQRAALGLRAGHVGWGRG